ncbi:MAG: response regulator transcription factor [Vicinamibacterales bacterium]|nr:response regulator transcription factor [Vicinamibacterales bacterium]
MRVLLVEDDPEISGFLVKGLREDRYLVDLVTDGPAAVDAASASAYDAILLDLMLPGLDGFDVCRQIRAGGVDTPVLVVSARDGVADRVRGLDCGADDYVVKPFAYAELEARVRALARRGRTRHLSGVLQYGPIEIDPVDHRASVHGHTLSLTATEYRLLTYLVRRAESIVSRDQLAEHVWGGEYDPASNLADVYVGYVRRKLQAVVPEPLIHTVRGLGYLLKDGPR